jgi:hypothetical protein
LQRSQSPSAILRRFLAASLAPTRYLSPPAALTCDSPKGVNVKKYRRVEINAYRRSVTIVSGEWSHDSFAPPAARADDLCLSDTDSCKPVEPDSPEGQLMLVEAVRSLKGRISPEARELICAGEDTFVPTRSTLKRLHSRLRLFVHSKVLHLSRNEDSAAKQSVED